MVRVVGGGGVAPPNKFASQLKIDRLAGNYSRKAENAISEPTHFKHFARPCPAESSWIPQYIVVSVLICYCLCVLDS